MKKILLLIIAMLVLVGCMPTHENKATINFEKDYSGTVVLTSELDTEYLEDPISEIEKKILKIAEDLEKFEAGSFKTKTENKVLVFTYTETFKDLDDLGNVLSRIYDDNVEITLEEVNNLFHNQLYLEGFDFNAASFADDIYDVIEKDEIFGDDSTEVRESKTGNTIPQIYFDGKSIALYENLSDDEYRHIQRDTLFIDIIDESTVNLVNFIEASDDLELDDLKDYYESNYKNRTLSEKSNSQLTIEKDVSTNSLTLSLENVSYEYIEDLQYEIFNRFIEVDVEADEESLSNGTFTIDIDDMGHAYSFEEVVLEREVNFDIDGFKILKVDDYEYEENGVYSFYREGSILSFEEGESFSLQLQKENSLQISNILQYILYGILALLAVLFIVVITVVIIRRNNNTKNRESVSSEEISYDRSLEENKLFKKITKEKLSGKIQSSVFSAGSLRHAIVLLVVTLITTGIFTMLIDFGDKGTMIRSIFENEYLSSSMTFDFMTGFKVLFIWITTGGISSSMIPLEYSPITLYSGFSIFSLLLGIIIIVVSYVISVTVFKTETTIQRNREILGGTFLFGLLIVVISFIPISIYDGARSLLNLSGSIKGDTVNLAFVIIPFNIILSAVLLTFKTHFNSINFEVSRIVFDGFKRFLIMFALAVIVSIGLLFTEYTYPIVLVFNLAAMIVALASGVTVEILDYFEVERFGLLITDHYSLYLLVGFLFVIVISIIGISKVYRRGNIANIGRFAFVYTTSMMIPVYVLAAIANMKVYSGFNMTSVNLNHGTILISFFVVFVVVFIATQLIRKEHPLYEPKQVEPVVVEKKVVVEDNTVQTNRTNKQRPMSGRRHRRR